MNTGFESMSEPKNLKDENIETAFQVLDKTSKEFEQDIEDFEEFVDHVLNKDFSQGLKNSNGLMNSKENGESVIDMYEEMFYANNGSAERVEAFAKNLGFSLPAADLFDEFANPGRRDKNQVYALVSNLEENNVNSLVLNNFREMAKDPVELREKVGEDLEIEKKSLWKYHKEVSLLYNRIDDLNKTNTLPMNLDSALSTVEEFEQIEERVEQLRNRRNHELRRRDEYMNGDFSSHEERFYEENDFQRPVLEELERVDDYIREARENIVLDF